MLAWTLDTALLVVFASLLATITWGWISATVADGVSGSVWRAVTGIVLTGGDAGAVAADVGGDLWTRVVRTIQQSLIILVVVDLLYRMVPALTGRTLGKATADLRVMDPATGRRPGPGRAFRRALVGVLGGTGLYALSWALLLEGWALIAFLVWVAAVAVFLAISVPALFGSRRTLADRVSGTTVVSADVYSRAWGLARDGVAEVRAHVGSQRDTALPPGRQQPALPPGEQQRALPPAQHAALPPAYLPAQGPYPGAVQPGQWGPPPEQYAPQPQAHPQAQPQAWGHYPPPQNPPQQPPGQDASRPQAHPQAQPQAWHPPPQPPPEPWGDAR